eukprot:gene17859-24247_t
MYRNKYVHRNIVRETASPKVPERSGLSGLPRDLSERLGKLSAAAAVFGTPGAEGVRKKLATCGSQAPEPGSRLGTRWASLPQFSCFCELHLSPMFYLVQEDSRKPKPAHAAARAASGSVKPASAVDPISSAMAALRQGVNPSVSVSAKAKPLPGLSAKERAIQALKRQNAGEPSFAGPTMKQPSAARHNLLRPPSSSMPSHPSQAATAGSPALHDHGLRPEAEGPNTGASHFYDRAVQHSAPSQYSAPTHEGHQGAPSTSHPLASAGGFRLPGSQPLRHSPHLPGAQSIPHQTSHFPGAQSMSVPSSRLPGAQPMSKPSSHLPGAHPMSAPSSRLPGAQPISRLPGAKPITSSRLPGAQPITHQPPRGRANKTGVGVEAPAAPPGEEMSRLTDVEQPRPESAQSQGGHKPVAPCSGVSPTTPHTFNINPQVDHIYEDAHDIDIDPDAVPAQASAPSPPPRARRLPFGVGASGVRRAGSISDIMRLAACLEPPTAAEPGSRDVVEPEEQVHSPPPPSPPHPPLPEDFDSMLINHFSVELDSGPSSEADSDEPPLSPDAPPSPLLPPPSEDLHDMDMDPDADADPGQASSPPVDARTHRMPYGVGVPGVHTDEPLGPPPPSKFEEGNIDVDEYEEEYHSSAPPSPRIAPLPEDSDSMMIQHDSAEVDPEPSSRADGDESAPPGANGPSDPATTAGRSQDCSPSQSTSSASDEGEYNSPSPHSRPVHTSSRKSPSGCSSPSGGSPPSPRRKPSRSLSPSQQREKAPRKAAVRDLSRSHHRSRSHSMSPAPRGAGPSVKRGRSPQGGRSPRKDRGYGPQPERDRDLLGAGAPGAAAILPLHAATLSPPGATDAKGATHAPLAPEALPYPPRGVVLGAGAGAEKQARLSLEAEGVGGEKQARRMPEAEGAGGEKPARLSPEAEEEVQLEEVEGVVEGECDAHVPPLALSNCGNTPTIPAAAAAAAAYQWPGLSQSVLYGHQGPLPPLTTVCVTRVTPVSNLITETTVCVTPVTPVSHLFTETTVCVTPVTPASHLFTVTTVCVTPVTPASHLFTETTVCVTPVTPASHLFSETTVCITPVTPYYQDHGMRHSSLAVPVLCRRTADDASYALSTIAVQPVMAHGTKLRVARAQGELEAWKRGPSVAGSRPQMGVHPMFVHGGDGRRTVASPAERAAKLQASALASALTASPMPPEALMLGMPSKPRFMLSYDDL